jgi:hypothetical protein
MPMPSAVLVTILSTLLVALTPASAIAQRRADMAAATPVARRASGCVVVASVLGGVGGAMVGGTVGVLVERAAYGGNPEAGITGFVVGIVVGAAVGAGAARRVCDEEAEVELGRHLRDLKEPEGTKARVWAPPSPTACRIPARAPCRDVERPLERRAVGRWLRRFVPQ